MSTPTLYLSKQIDELLERRGIAPGVKGGQRNLSAAVRRALELLDRLSTLANPAAKLGRPAYDFAVQALYNAWGLEAAQIQTLDTHFRGMPNLPALAKERGVDLDDFFARLASLDFAERLALVDHAQQHHARSS